MEMSMAEDEALFTINMRAIYWDVLSELEYFTKDQLPYIQAKTLFDVTHDARRKTIEELHKKFTIRTKPRPWAERALRVDPRSPTLIKKEILSGKGASVSLISKDPLGRLLTDGGRKNINNSGKGKDPFKSEHGFGVPFAGTGRRTPMTVIREGRNSPQDIIQKKGGFLAKTKAGKTILIMPPKKYKKNKGLKNEEKRKEIYKSQRKIMFVMEHEVKIKPWWNFREILMNGMLEWLPNRFVQAAKKAMETRKQK